MKILSQYKVFSGALQFTLFIGIIIAILLGSLILLQNTHRILIRQSKATIENIQLANSGINYLLNYDELFSDTLSIGSLGNTNQKVEVNLSLWGIFEKGTVKATHRKKILYKSALLGTKLESGERPNLYLQDNYKPLLIVGNTLLKGIVYVPNKEIRPGYIAEESYYGKKLVDGIIKKSDPLLPKLKTNYRENIENFTSSIAYNSLSFLTEEELMNKTCSFLKPTKIYYKKAIIELSNNILTGNIIIKSDTGVIIKKTAVLKDVIILAPRVEVEDNAYGNFQIIASKKIIIGENCKFNYPSSVVLIPKKESLKTLNSPSEENQIIIGKNSEIKGSVCYFKSTKDNDFNTQITVSENTVVKGEIYCQGNLELMGKIIGSVYTEQFIVNTAGSIFVNHIYNGQITSGLPDSFCGLLFDNNPKGIAKWIY